MAANNVYLQVDFNSQQAQQNVNALNQAIGNTGTVADKSSKQATQALNSVSVQIQQTTRAFGELTGVLAGLGVGRMLSSIIQVGSELDRVQVAMKAFTGSGAEAAAVFKEIQAVAAQSPFKFKDLEETGRQLLGFGMAAKQVPATLRVITDQVAAMGGSIESVNTIVRIFGRVMEKDFVGGMDLLRALPQLAVPVMEGLRKALSKQFGEAFTTEQVRKFIKEGVLDPLETLRVIQQTMAAHTAGAGARVNDVAKAWKNFGDGLDRVKQRIEDEFGPALAKLIDELPKLLAPLEAVLGWFLKLDEPTKEWIVNIGVGTVAVIALTTALTGLKAVAGPLFSIVFNLGSVLAKSLLVVLTNPALAAGILAVTGAVALWAYKFPDQAKKVEDAALKFATDLWGKLKNTAQRLAKESGLMELFDPKVPKGDTGDTSPGKKNSQDAIDALKAQIDEWSAAAGKTMLQALSSPVEAIEIKYKELFDKLHTLMFDKLIRDDVAENFTKQLNIAKAMEMESKLFEKTKQDISEKAKLDAERVKGSYDIQIAYIEALDAQDLQHKVAAIDHITALRIASVEKVAAVEKDAVEQTLAAQLAILRDPRFQDLFTKAGINVEDAAQARTAEAAQRLKLIGQKATDEEQKYRLEGWKKANDAIIEDQKRVYEAFQSMFDEIFDAFTQKTKSIGQALGDVFKKLFMGEVKQLFSSTAASLFTEVAGYGTPEPQIKRSGGIFSILAQRGMPPRAPGAPPDIYSPERPSEKIGPAPGAPGSATPAEAISEFTVGVDAFNQATVRFALAMAQMHAPLDSTYAEREDTAGVRVDSSAGGLSGIFDRASTATGVNSSLLRAVAQVESSFRPDAVSSKGAMGLMQLMPATARALGMTDPFNAEQSVMGGARNLQQLLAHYGGDQGAALAAYNMGQPAYDRAVASGAPLPNETYTYVSRVMGAMGQQATGKEFNFATTAYAGAASGDYGGETTGSATPSEIEHVKQASVLAKTLGVPLSALLTAFGGSQQHAGPLGPVGALANIFKGGKGLSNLKDLFGIDKYGATTVKSVLGSKGVAGLAGVGGGLLLSAGLSHHAAPLTVAGGALTGFSMAKTLGMTGPGAAVLGGGLGLVAAGVQRGGGVGLAMDVGGGALAGAAIGTQILPGVGTLIGAAVGAVAGAITGVVRLFVHTEQEKIRTQIKQVYGIDISNRQLLTQIQQIVDQKYGGNVAVGIRSQDVQDIIRLYALSTGQAAMLPRPMYNATIAQGNGGLQMQPVYQGGVQVKNPYSGVTTWQYQSAVAAAQGIGPGGGLGVPNAGNLINQQWSALTVQTIQGNPAAIANASAAAARAGDSRLTTAGAMQEPLTLLS